MSYQKEKLIAIRSRATVLKEHVHAFYNGDKFFRTTNSLLVGIRESNDDMDKTREQVAKLRDELNKIKLKISKENSLGKSDSVLNPLKRDWQRTQEKIKQAWAEYDKKHGTQYAKQYED